MKKVLIIAYFFPPIGGGGVTRPLKFHKYLPDHQWESHILTVRSGGFWVMDAERQNQVTSPERVHRARAFTPFSFLKTAGKKDDAARKTGRVNFLRKISDFFLVPDAYIGWLPFALAKGIRLHRKHRFDLILATSPPPTTLVIGTCLSRMLGIPLAADFRDLWVGEYFYAPPTRIHHVVHQTLHQLVINQARLITTRSPKMTGFLRQMVGCPVTDPRFVTVTNGFDPEDLPAVASRKPHGNRPVRLTHTGSLTMSRTIEPLAAAIRQLLDEKALAPGDVVVDLYGRRDDVNDQIVSDFNLEEVIRFYDSVSHPDALQIQIQSDALLLVANRVPESLRAMILPGKLFEYLGIAKPVFALVPQASESTQIMEQSGCGIAADLNDPADIREKLLSLILGLKNNTFEVTPDRDFLKNFEYPDVTARLSGFLDRIS